MTDQWPTANLLADQYRAVADAIDPALIAVARAIEIADALPPHPAGPTKSSMESVRLGWIAREMRLVAQDARLRAEHYSQPKA